MSHAPRTRRGRTRPDHQQLELAFPLHGGARKGAGRKRRGSRPNVPHTAREPISRHHPVHVTLRLGPGLPSLRTPHAFDAMQTAFAASCDRLGMGIAHYSVLANHAHILVEVESRRALSCGVQGLCVRMAGELNGLWQRTGRVFADRFHEHVLKTPWEVRNALVYVLRNARKHGIRLDGPFDPYSTAAQFDGWAEEIAAEVLEEDAPPCAEPRTWLLRAGWRMHGLISIDEEPRA